MSDHTTETLKALFDGRPVISHDEAAKALLMTARGLREIGNDGEIAYTSIGKRKRGYTLATINEFLRRKPCQSTSEPTSRRKRTGIASKSKGGGFMEIRDARAKARRDSLSASNAQ